MILETLSVIAFIIGVGGVVHDLSQDEEEYQQPGSSYEEQHFRSFDEEAPDNPCGALVQGDVLPPCAIET